jgi:hypothetical protein
MMKNEADDGLDAKRRTREFGINSIKLSKQ